MVELLIRKMLLKKKISGMKLKEGDIFKIPIDDVAFGVGQIVCIPNKQSLSIVVYGEKFDSSCSIDDILELLSESTPFLFGNTFDAKFYHKHWTVISNGPVRYITPFYKIGHNPVYVEDMSGSKIRKANAEEEKKLTFRKYVAPVRIENAYLSKYGKGEWNNDLYEPLLYTYNIQSNSLVISNQKIT